MNDPEFFAKVLDTLTANGYVAKEAAAKVAAEMQRGIPFYSALGQAKVNPKGIRAVLEEVAGVGALDPTLMTIDQELLADMASLLSPHVIIRDRIFPTKIELNALQVVMHNPLDRELIGDLEALSGCRVSPQVCHDEALTDIIEKSFKSALQSLPPKFHQETPQAIRKAVFESRKKQPLQDYVDRAEKWINVNKEKMVSDPEALKVVIRHPAVIQLVHQVLTRLVYQGCSDVHFEPLENEYRIRARIDGAMRTVASLPTNFKLPITARLKVMAGLPPAPARMPQDSQINYNVIFGKMIEFRFSALPSILGEKIVVRVLDRSRQSLPLNAIFPKDDEATVSRVIHSPNGLILVTGPTGSGKTMTLYAVLAELNKVDVNIVTAENPVESKVAGITQVQCDPDTEGAVGFGDALRSFLRQDPDIIMVGEIRDQETAEISLKAALTGHLVLSTLHTNDAAASIMRLTNMKLDPFLIAAALRMVIAQRLVRLLCKECKVPVPRAESAYGKILETFPKLDGEKLTIYKKGTGCATCEKTGYKGRRGIFEVLVVSPAVQELIIKEQPITEIVKQLRSEGMASLFDSGLAFVAQGVTSFEEVMRVAAA
ncbi:MAG: ATPase, T2SS/T4P/T4SS family [Acidobacteriota bacterium]